MIRSVLNLSWQRVRLQAISSSAERFSTHAAAVSLPSPTKSNATNTDGNIWYLLSGFSKFAARSDLMAVLGDVKVDRIEPLIGNNRLPVGKYMIQLPASEENKLKERLRMKSSIQGVVIADKIPFWTKKSANLSGIDNCSVRCTQVSTILGEDELYTMFEKFHLSSKPIERISQMKWPYYIIHFATPEEAERAAVEMNGFSHDGNNLRLFWFQF